MNNPIDSRFAQAWSFFLDNAGPLILGSLVVCLGLVLVVPGPWVLLNLLGEIAGALRERRKVRWQATYQRTSTFLPAWGLTLSAGIAIAFGLGLCIFPGVLLALAWLHAPLMVAEGTPVLEALRRSPARLHSPEDWIGTLLDSCVLAACVLAASVTGVLTVVAIPVGLAFLALCSINSTELLAERVEPADATA